MLFAASNRVRRFGALGLAAVVASLVLQSVFLYAGGRIQLARDKGDLVMQYRQLIERRVDIPVLERQLALLSTSDQIRQLTLEAPNDRSALVKLQQLARLAIDQGKGKLLSAIESRIDQQDNTVALLVRARLPENALSLFIGQMENGNPRVRVDDLSLVSRAAAPGEAGDVELTATFRVRWLAAGKS